MPGSHARSRPGRRGRSAGTRSRAPVPPASPRLAVPGPGLQRDRPLRPRRARNQGDQGRDPVPSRRYLHRLPPDPVRPDQACLHFVRRQRESGRHPAPRAELRRSGDVHGQTLRRDGAGADRQRPAAHRQAGVVRGDGQRPGFLPQDHRRPLPAPASPDGRRRKLLAALRPRAHHRLPAARGGTERRMQRKRPRLDPPAHQQGHHRLAAQPDAGTLLPHPARTDQFRPDRGRRPHHPHPGHRAAAQRLD